MDVCRKFAKSSTKTDEIPFWKFSLGEVYAIEGGNLKIPAGYALPNLAVTKEKVAPAAARHTKRCDWWVAAEVVTYGKVERAITSFAPYKSPGMEGIFLALLKEGWMIVVPFLVRTSHACLANGYAPDIRHQVKVVFIPKTSRSSYTGPRDCRPIGITSFLLKTMERLVDRFLRDKTLALMPLHPNQQAYQARKSM
jgi:hypothetical protein